MVDKNAINREIENLVASFIVASFSNSMLDLTASPTEALRKMSASPTASMEALASPGESLTVLSSRASLPASMADLMASFSGNLQRLIE